MKALRMQPSTHVAGIGRLSRADDSMSARKKAWLDASKNTGWKPCYVMADLRCVLITEVLCGN